MLEGMPEIMNPELCDRRQALSSIANYFGNSFCISGEPGNVQSMLPALNTEQDKFDWILIRSGWGMLFILWSCQELWSTPQIFDILIPEPTQPETGATAMAAPRDVNFKQ